MLYHQSDHPPSHSGLTGGVRCGGWAAVQEHVSQLSFQAVLQPRVLPGPRGATGASAHCGQLDVASVNHYLRLHSRLPTCNRVAVPSGSLAASDQLSSMAGSCTTVKRLWGSGACRVTPAGSRGGRPWIWSILNSGHFELARHARIRAVVATYLVTRSHDRIQEC